MNKNVLTLLGCSGSLGLMLAVGNAANAGTLPSQFNGVATPATTSVGTASTSLTQGASQYANLDPNSDTIGDLAIAKFSCDCPACRNAIVQMILSGQMNPQ